MLISFSIWDNLVLKISMGLVVPHWEPSRLNKNMSFNQIWCSLKFEYLSWIHIANRSHRSRWMDEIKRKIWSLFQERKLFGWYTIFFKIDDTLNIWLKRRNWREISKLEEFVFFNIVDQLQYLHLIFQTSSYGYVVNSRHLDFSHWLLICDYNLE